MSIIGCSFRSERLVVRKLNQKRSKQRLNMACRSKLGVEKLLYWVTELPYEEKSPLRSSNFWLMGSEWYLLFSFRKNGLYHVLSLHRVTDGPVQLTFSAKTCLAKSNLGYDGNGVAQQQVYVVNRETNLWHSMDGTVEYIYRHIPSLHQSGQVKFVFMVYDQPPSAVRLYTGKCLDRTLEKSVQVSSQVPRDVEALSSDLSRLLDKEILPDVTLKCGDRNFRAHRVVLAARSDVFRAMFQNETLESETGDVTIQDMEVGVLEKLLKFIYTGRPDDLSEDCTSELYEAADKYDVLSLKMACSYWIERNLTVDNCVKYLKVADSHSDIDLKAATVSFITENPGVLKSESWFAISKECPVLANEVLQAYVAATVK